MSSSGIELALDMALRKRDAAAHTLAQARQAWLGAQVQLDQLESYAQESGARWSTQSAAGSPELLRHHYQFMARLSHATALQTGIVAERERTMTAEATALREAEAKLEALRQLVAARAREKQRVADRREQKQTDERAALQFRRLAGGTLGGGL